MHADRGEEIGVGCAQDSEKITINLGYVDLGQIDLLVREGFYSNRTDFIRTAIRNLLDRHDETVKRSVARHQLELGLRRFTRSGLEAVATAIALAICGAKAGPRPSEAAVRLQKRAKVRQS